MYNATNKTFLNPNEKLNHHFDLHMEFKEYLQAVDDSRRETQDFNVKTGTDGT